MGLERQNCVLRLIPVLLQIFTFYIISVFNFLFGILRKEVELAFCGYLGLLDVTDSLTVIFSSDHQVGISLWNKIGCPDQSKMND